jgi:polysaccharide export outer membrane protein
MPVIRVHSRPYAAALLLLFVSIAAAQAPSSYILGPDDQITVRALDVEEISEKPVRVDMRGFISLPLIGRLRAAGLTAEQLESEIAARLRKYLTAPDVSVAVTEFRSQPVSVLGAVGNPGVLQLQGRKSLFEILSMAGGLKPEAGNTINITRQKQWGPIPLKSAKPDPTGQFTVAEVSVRSVMDAKNPEENIQILPNDVISVPKADIVYVIGSVRRAGGFPLNERETITVLQALSLAEGLERTAAPKSAKILRMTPGNSARTELPVNLKKILAGESSDVPLQADDILFVPNSAAKSASLRTVEAAIQITTGIIIWRR